MRRVVSLALVAALAVPAAAATPAAPAPASPAPAASATTAPWAASGIDWAKLPPLGPEPTFTPPKPQQLKLKNGMRLLVVENHRLPLVSMQLVVEDAGAAQDPAGKSGLAGLTADLLDEGAGGLSALALAEQLETLGASLTLYAGTDDAGLAVETLSRTLDPTLELVARVLTAPALADEEFKRVLDDRLTGLKLRPDQPRVVASLLLDIVLFGGHAAYGRPAAGYLAELQTITAADVRAFHAARWVPKAMTLVVVGDVDARALAARLDALLGSWAPKGAKAAPVKAPAAKPATRLFIVDRPGAEQADVRLGLVAIGPKDKRNPAFDVLANLLGGTFTSRLNRRLREELGWTYGARASLDQDALAGRFTISTALVTPHAVEGVAEILKIIADVGAGRVPADELGKARLNLVRELPQRFETNEGTASAFAGLVSLGLPLDWYAGYGKRIGAVKRGDLEGVAKLVPAGRLVVVVVGDAAVLRPGLEQLLGPATVVSADLAPPARPAPPRTEK